MLTQDQLQKFLNTHPLVEPRLRTLALAAELNPDFKTPHIQGGYLRNIALDVEPNDCDVFFAGTQRNQPGVIEAVKKAEAILGLDYDKWEFENLTATGVSGDFLADSVGQHGPYTDHASTLIMSSDGELKIGGPETLNNLANRIYDLRLTGIEVWATHRGQGRSYASCILGDLIRALYLCHDLNLTPSPCTADFLNRFDSLFRNLEAADQQSRINFWLKKTKGDPSYRPTLSKFNITSLPIIND
jgi:hypothetical protein